MTERPNLPESLAASSATARAMTGNAVCSECRRPMLNGVMPVEPPFFCPNHPDATPMAVEPCEECGGRGWHIAPGAVQLEFQAALRAAAGEG